MTMPGVSPGARVAANWADDGIRGGPTGVLGTCASSSSSPPTTAQPARAGRAHRARPRHRRRRRRHAARDGGRRRPLRPELIVCPMLKTIIPQSIFERHRLIVHPGPKGDRGPSSLDWAIELGAREWGVTVLEASAEVDGGDVWASGRFRMREAGKSSLYRHEVRRAAIDAVVRAVRGRRRRRRGPAAARPLGSSRVRAPAPAPQTGGPRDRLERRHHRDGAPADPRRRGPSRRPRRDRGEPFHLFGGHREGLCAAGRER